MKQKIEPIRCVCGRKPRVHSAICYHICCGSRGGTVCWYGPVRKSEHGAIRAWNRVMGAARAALEVKP